MSISLRVSASVALVAALGVGAGVAVAGGEDPPRAKDSAPRVAPATTAATTTDAGAPAPAKAVAGKKAEAEKPNPATATQPAAPAADAKKAEATSSATKSASRKPASAPEGEPAWLETPGGAVVCRYEPTPRTVTCQRTADDYTVRLAAGRGKAEVVKNAPALDPGAGVRTLKASGGWKQGALSCAFMPTYLGRAKVDAVHCGTPRGGFSLGPKAFWRE